MARARRTSAAITYDGPFFSPDREKTYRQNIRLLMDRVAEVGEADVRARLAVARRGNDSGSAIAYVRGRTSSLTGRRWAVSAVISADTSSLDRAGAIAVQAKLSGRRVAVGRDGRNIGTTRGMDGRRAFAGTARGLRRVLKDADLMKGIG
jgi:hypothetical protein